MELNSEQVALIEAGVVPDQVTVSAPADAAVTVPMNTEVLNV